MSTDKDLKQLIPWYKEPWGIFVFAPLFIVVITCSIMVTIAFKYADDVIKDEYVKTGKLYEKSFAAEKRAKVLNISADITIDLDTSLLSLTMHATDVVNEATLSLGFLHPVNEDFDQFYTLHRVSVGHYEIALPKKPTGRWYVQLQNTTDMTAENREVELPVSDTPLTNDEHWRVKQVVNFDNTHNFSLSSQIDFPK